MIRANDVSKVTGETTLLAPVDLEARPGECLVLRGPNGSGKTTLLRILAGTLPATTGEAQLDGQALDERTAHTRTHVAALLGPSTTYRDLTLGDHLILIDSTWGGAPGDAWSRAESMLELLEIGHLAKRFPHELSSGQQQLFQLALVLFRPSSVLLLDEPEQRLDTHKRRLLTRILADRKGAGATLVIACHDPEMTEALADYVLDLGDE
ncbi:MAG TPA: ABC transporter ATP-binding protein [Segeticoccus sp.]|uniref:ABC transporter ATP-binding protein n=1 Tax=Segeticoccus sp. TaxID=2706531 RepID=UPI002D810636|nr:ABC transporter ATP-binding protein [Segeticoccus sp.]HET8598774.1 ABC transporter ATP-binding protein [Segeticoccus sp.]